MWKSKPACARARAALRLAVARQRDQQRVARLAAGCAGGAPPRSRSCPAGRCPAAPRRAGTRAAISSAAWPSCAVAHLEAFHLQQRHQRLGRRRQCRRRPGCAAGARRPARCAAAGGGVAPAPASARRGRQAHRRPRLPLPRPSLAASTVPPCSSTRCFTSVRPMPRPPCERSSDWSRLREQVEHVRQQLRRDAGAVVPHRDAALRRPRSSRAAGCGCPSGENLAALLSRFDSTCASRTASPSSSIGSLRAARRRARCSRRLDARRARLDRALDQRRQLERLGLDQPTLPCTMRETSSRSSIRRAMWSACRPITSRAHRQLRRRASRAGQDVHGVADRRQRVAQLVRQHREEFVLAPVGLLHRRVQARVLHRDRGAAGELADRARCAAASKLLRAAQERERAADLVARHQRADGGGALAPPASASWNCLSRITWSATSAQLAA